MRVSLLIAGTGDLVFKVSSLALQSPWRVHPPLHVLWSSLCEPSMLVWHQAPRFVRHSLERGVVGVLEELPVQAGQEGRGETCAASPEVCHVVHCWCARASPFLQHVHASSSHVYLSFPDCPLCSIHCLEISVGMYVRHFKFNMSQVNRVTLHSSQPVSFLHSKQHDGSFLTSNSRGHLSSHTKVSPLWVSLAVAARSTLALVDSSTMCWPV